MHPITVTLTFDSLTAASQALGLLDYAAQPPTIRYEDRPDVGATPLPELPAAPVTPPPRPSLEEMFPAPAAPAAAVAPVPTPAAVAPSVPVAPFPPAPPAASLPETATGRDSEGMPWDARIHASNKSTNQDGTWRQRRGLNDPALKGRVEAELRAGMNAPVLTPETALAAALSSMTSAPTPPTAVTAEPTAAPVASLPPPPAPPAPAPAPTDATPTVASFLARISPLLTADKTVTVKLNQALTAAGLTGIGALLGNPAHLGTVSAVFDSLMAEAA